MDKKFVSKENAAVLYDALKSYVDTEVSDASTQYTVMPAASAENEGQIIQYIGQTDQNYTNGYFYQVISDGAAEPTYSWVGIDTQHGSVELIIWDGSTGSTPEALATAERVLQAVREGKWPLVKYSGNGWFYQLVSFSNTYYALEHLQVGAGTGVYFNKLNNISCYKMGIDVNSSTGKATGLMVGQVQGSFPTSYTGPILYQDATYNNIETYKVLSVTNTYSYTPTSNYHPATKKYVDDKATSYTTVPTASASNEGKIIQYTGATDSTYTNGYFYKCVSDGQEPATYSWVAIPTQNVTHPEYTLAVATTTSGYAKSYELTKDGVATGVKIDIPKDLVISSGEVKTVTTADVPYAGAQVGDKYIDITLNDSSASHIYIPVNDLVDAYTAGNGINIDANNQVSIKLDSSNANGITVGANGISLAEATTNTSGAMSAADKTKLATVSSNADENVIEIVKVNGSALTPDADKAVNITVPSVPNFSSGTADPTGGSDGDIYFQYSA